MGTRRMKKATLLNILLVFLALICFGCGKAGLKDPVFLPGTEETFLPLTEAPPAPKYGTGDIVRYRMLPDRRGIMMSPDYKYLPNMKTWYCVVDFYPSSALIHFDFSQFDNYERRYVYEFELELVRKFSKDDQYKRNRWIR